MIDVFITLLIIALVLLGVGVIQKKPVFTIFSGLLFIVCGGMTIFGLSYVTSYTITDVNSTSTFIQNNYATWNNVFLTIPTGIVLLLLGVYMIFISILALNTNVESGHDEE